MKTKVTLLFAVAICAFKINAQVVFSENFTSPFTPSLTGWVLQNNSVPTPFATWDQGDAATFFPSYNGGPDDYMSVGFYSGGNSSNIVAGISNWLITPELTIHNGAVLTFATRKIDNNPNTNYPDRMQVRMSTSGAASSVPTGSTSVGPFTDLLLDINPLYSLNTTSAITNGSVNGYPMSWTVYSLTISGITGTVTGRYAFRYFVDDGGPLGANSSIIGLDAVSYTSACNYPQLAVANQTICSGNSVTLTASGANSYSWSTGAITNTITDSPTALTVYTVTGTNQSCSDTKTVSVDIGANLSVFASSTTSTVCSGSGTTLTLTAYGAAATYTWLPVNQSATTITVSPTAPTTYTLVGQNGTCVGEATVNITISQNPTITASSSPSIACAGQEWTLTASGNAASYYWVNGPQHYSDPAVFSTNNLGVYTFSLYGTSSSGCVTSTTLNQTVSACTDINSNTVTNNTVTVYPNPFSSDLTISGITGAVEIFNTLGQMVLTTTVSEKEAINTSSLTKGIYFVKVKNNQSTEEQTIKVIKN